MLLIVTENALAYCPIPQSVPPTRITIVCGMGRSSPLLDTTYAPIMAPVVGCAILVVQCFSLKCSYR